MKKVQLGDHDPLDYFPLYQGMKPSSAQMKVMKPETGNLKTNIFQIDNKWAIYREAKEEARKERLGKYYQTLNHETSQKDIAVCKYIIDTLLTEYPQHFSNKTIDGLNYLSCSLSQEILVYNDQLDLVAEKSIIHTAVPFVDLYDALAMQVSEDLVVYSKLDESSHATSRIHLSHANGWSAEWAVGQNFQYIHEGVPRITQIMPRMEPIVQSLFKLPRPIERVGAISFRTDTLLNRHPEVPENLMHQAFDKDNYPHLFMRVERQTVSSFVAEAKFLFTIKTYFVDCKHPDMTKRNAVIEAFTNLNEKAYKYEWMRDNQNQVLEWLKK